MKNEGERPLKGWHPPPPWVRKGVPLCFDNPLTKFFKKKNIWHGIRTNVLQKNLLISEWAYFYWWNLRQIRKRWQKDAKFRGYFSATMKLIKQINGKRIIAAWMEGIKARGRFTGTVNYCPYFEKFVERCRNCCNHWYYWVFVNFLVV
jgi:hypothetical protein